MRSWSFWVAGIGFLAFVTSCADDDETTPGTCAGTCSRATYHCVTSVEPTFSAPAAIDSPQAYGCSGTIGPPELRPLWIHCDTNQVCVEHETECLPAHWLANGFSYDIGGSMPRTITCTTLTP